MKQIALIAAIAALPLAASLAQDWPRFRGANGDGVGEGAAIPASWGDGDYNWRVTLPGEGHSSPVLWGSRIFVSSADGGAGRRWLLCIDADSGSTLWRREFPFADYKKHKNNSFASSTPAADAERVYVLWQSREESALVALDHEGEEKWRFDPGPFRGGHGGAISPIVVDDLVILGNDHEGDSALFALDSASGELRWKVDRRSTRATYATPCVFRPEGRGPEIIFSDWEQGVTAVDAKTGQVNWEIDVFGDEAERAIGSPVIAGDLVIATCGFVTSTKHCVALRTKGTADGVRAEEAWRIERAVPHIPTPLAHDGRLYLWTEQGILTCLRAESGEKIYQERVGGSFFGSPVLAGGRIYCVSEDGECLVVAAGDEYRELARVDLGEECRSTPAISGGRLILRTASHLMSVGGR